MELWNRYPVFRVFLTLSAGILWANFTYTPFNIFVIALVIFGVLVFITAFTPYIFRSYARRWWFGVFLNLFFLCLGVVISHLYSNRQSKLHLHAAPVSEEHFYIQLEENPQEKENSYGVRARLLGTPGRSSLYNTKLMLYLQKSSEAASLRYGDRLLLKGRLNELEGPKNPYEFDYKNYLNLKAIYYQAYADSAHWKLISREHGFWAMDQAKKIRAAMLGIIDRWQLPENNKAITKALLLGYRYDIDDDQLKSYAAAGAMHVLAVSGLHVGIVYLMASYALIFLLKIPRGAAIRTILLIILLWFYACLTGLSASVVRAATMFTFVAIGTGFQRNTSVYNTILGSALLLLLIKPTYLFEVGFQLSYAAVFGIVWLQPKLEALWQPQNWAWKQIWAITTVSLAAQLVTFPLGLYYFHQFPTLFLLSNLMVIPLVTLLMYIGLLTLIISTTGFIPCFLVSLYGTFLYLMNGGVNWVEQQTALLIEHIHITRWELILLYLIIISLSSWCFAGGYRRLAMALSGVVLLSASQLWEKLQLGHHQEMVVYSVRKHNALGFYSPDQNLFLSDAEFLDDEDALTFHVKHHWWARDVAEPVKLNISEDYSSAHFSKHSDLLRFGNQVIWIISKNATEVPKADIWLATQNGKTPHENSYKPRLLLLGGDLGYYDRQRWVEWASPQNIDTWDCAEDGAFVQEIPMDTSGISAVTSKLARLFP